MSDKPFVWALFEEWTHEGPFLIALFSTVEAAKAYAESKYKIRPSTSKGELWSLERDGSFEAFSGSGTLTIEKWDVES